MADSRHLGFRFWAIISALINIFAPNFTPRWKIGSSEIRLSKIQDGGRPPSWNKFIVENIFGKYVNLQAP